MHRGHVAAVVLARVEVLRRDVDVLAELPDGLPNLRLVAVSGGRIDVAVPAASAVATVSRVSPSSIMETPNPSCGIREPSLSSRTGLRQT
jgi:hypothetical protein